MIVLNLRLFTILLPTRFGLFSAIVREVIHIQHLKLLVGLHLHHTCVSNVFNNSLKVRVAVCPVCTKINFKNMF